MILLFRNCTNCVNSKIQYRSFKDFDVNKYISDLDNTVYLHDSSESVDDINTMYNDFETKVSRVIDHHAPIKYRYPRKKLSTVYEQRAEKSHIQKTNATIEIWEIQNK